jgi:DNA-directed RNA polymerase specialized sigma24 family protein
VTTRADGLSDAQWGEVVAALPELQRLARSVARRCNGHTSGELLALAEDSAMRRVRHHDPQKGRLMAFAQREIRLDLIRAANKRAHDPFVSAGLRGFDLHAEAIDVPDVASCFAETPEEKNARALALGGELIAAAHYGQAAARAAQTPEDDLAERERWDALKKTAAGSSDEVARLLEMLYEHDLTWEEAAERLQMNVRAAQRLAEKAMARVRAAAEARGRFT